MRRVALKPGKPLKRRKPLRRRSEQKRADDAVWAIARAERLDIDGHRCRYGDYLHLTRCEDGIYGDVCGRPDLHVHHILPRGAGGTHQQSNLVTLCAKHHDWVHNGDPVRAREMGLLR